MLTDHSLIVTACSACAGGCMWFEDAILDEALEGAAPIADTALPVLAARPAAHGFELGRCVPIFVHLYTPSPPPC